MTPGRSAALAREVAPELVSAGNEREIAVDRSNDCVVVDEAVFVKWLTPPVPEPHHGLDVWRHLDLTGFEAMPALLGTQIVDGKVNAIVVEHVADSDDGWTWLFDHVNAADDGNTAGGDPLADAARLGTIAAELHLALSTPSAVVPEPVGSGGSRHGTHPWEVVARRRAGRGRPTRASGSPPRAALLPAGARGADRVDTGRTDAGDHAPWGSAHGAGVAHG